MLVPSLPYSPDPFKVIKYIYIYVCIFSIALFLTPRS
jgi:hypothetical protein